MAIPPSLLHLPLQPQTLAMAKLLTLMVLLALASLVDGRTYRASIVFSDDEAPNEQRLYESDATAAYHARRLVHDNTWASMATTSRAFDGVAYANIVSFSDSIGDSDAASTGELFFYLTPMDATAADLQTHPNASVSISFAQQGPSACKMDVEDPTCWRITLLGSVVPVSADRVEYAQKVLFSRHPEMKYWPSNHGFRPYVMELAHIVLLDFYGGAKHIRIEDYYNTKL